MRDNLAAERILADQTLSEDVASPRNPAEIFHRYYQGDSLTDQDVLEGVKFYYQLSRLLYKTGPVFRLAAQEANSVFLGLESYAKARHLKLPKTIK
jgi:hypothetical protein